MSAAAFSSSINTNLPANFSSSLSYDPTHVYLNFALSSNFGSPLNVNQQNVANVLINSFNANGGIPVSFGTLTPSGLTQASGEAARDRSKRLLMP